MTEQEKLNSRVKRKIAVQDANIKALTEELREFKNEMRDFKQEIRQQNQMRAAEIVEIRKSVESIQESGRNQTIVTFLGIAAMVVAVLLK